MSYRKTSSSRYQSQRDDRFTIDLFGRRSDFRNAVGNKILENSQTYLPDRCVVRGNRTLKVINTPDFFDEECQHPDQHIVDCMALSYPGPNLFLLTIDSEDCHGEEVLDQIAHLKRIFGETITAHLVVVVPTTEILKLCHSMKGSKIHLEPMTDKLSRDCKNWCSGQRSFHYNFNNYSHEVVRRRKSILEKRLQPQRHQGSEEAEPWTPSGSQPTLTGTEPRTPSSSQPTLTGAEPRIRRSFRRSFRGPRASGDTKSQFNIILLGLTGTGKSASANTILAAARLSRNSAFFKTDLSSTPVTTRCATQTVMFLKKTVTVVDTPDLFSDHLRNSKAQVEECRKYCELRQTMVLLVIQLGRFTDQEVGILEKLEAKLGLKIREKTVVLLTNGEQFNGSLEKFIGDRLPLKRIVEACGNRCHVFKNSSRDPRQVLELIKKFPDVDVFLPELTERRSVFQCFPF